MANDFIRIQEADFDLTTEIKALRKNDPRVGAVVTFVGTVRDLNDGSQIKGMTLEHYPGMTEKALEESLGSASHSRDSSCGPIATRRSNCFGGSHERAQRRSICCLRVHHGLSQNSSPILEKRRDPRGC